MKIIKHVHGMRPAPAIPEEARRYFIEGSTLIKTAKGQGGYMLALEAYQKCLLIALWWPEAYYNYGVALELANHYDEAVSILKLYIATTPGVVELRKAQDKIYEIGAKKKISAQENNESSPRTVTVRESSKFDDWLAKLDSRRYLYQGSDGDRNVLDVRGKFLVRGAIYDGSYIELAGEATHIEIRGRETTIPIYEHESFQKVWSTSFTYIISENGDSITLRSQLSDSSVREYVFLWQR
jgi:hypothetical protein